MLKTESRMCIFSCDYANMMSLVTLRLFSAFKGGYPSFLSDMNFLKFRMQTTFQINLLPFPITCIRRYTEMD